MAIQLPEVKRIEPTAPASVGRIEARIPDAERGVAQTQNALEGVAGQAIKFRNDQADQMADTVATDAANKFEIWHKKQMYGDPQTGSVGIINQQGNPTDTYRDFYKAADEQLKSLSNGSDQWDTETQNLVNRRLSKKVEELKLQTLTEYGHQQNKFDDGITESGVGLAKQSIPAATTIIDPDSIAKGDKSTLGLVQKKVASISDLRIAQALRYGGASLDKNGDMAYTDPAGVDHRVTVGGATKLKIAKDTSEALTDSIMNLIDTSHQDPGAIAKAKVMKEQFGEKIDAHNMAKLSNAFEKADITHQAFDLSAKANGKSPTQIDAMMADVDPEVRHKALQYISDNGRFRENIRRAQWQDNYAGMVQKAMQFKANNPAATESDLQKQPFYAKFARNMNPKDLKAVDEVAAPPKISSPEAIARTARILSGDDPEYPDPRNIPPELQPKVTQGLNQADRDRALKKMNAFGAQSGAEEYAQHARVMTELKTQAFRAGIIHPDNETRSDVTKGGSQDQKLGEMQDELSRVMDKYGSTNPEQNRKIVHDYLINKAQGKTFDLPKRFQAVGPAFGTSAAKAPPAAAPMSVVQVRAKALKDFQNQNGRPPSKPELDTYISSDKTGRYK
jgi:hypothetical protein